MNGEFRLGNRVGITIPNATPAAQHLSHRYLRLLVLHDRYRASIATWDRARKVATALDVVRQRMAALTEVRLAA